MQTFDEIASDTTPKVPWNKGKLLGSKPPLQTKQVWAIRTKLQVEHRLRDLAMFNLAIDSKLRGCDLVSLKVEDVAPHGFALERATVRQRKTGHPVKFELTEQTREAIDAYMARFGRRPGDFLFASRRNGSRCISTRQYARLLASWTASVGLDPRIFGTHSLRRTKAALIYRRTGNLRPCSCYSVTPRSRARSVISASRLTTPWRSPSRWMSEIPGQSRHALPNLLRPSSCQKQTLMKVGGTGHTRLCRSCRV